MIEQPMMVKICDIREESPDVKTFFFSKGNLRFEPGQFVMVWLPLLDEKPFAVSYLQNDVAGISVLRRGIFTQSLHDMKIGGTFGIRGPYGRGFDLQPGACAVGGGIGMASLATLVDRLPDITILQGARTASGIIYQNRFRGMKVCTDDGSLGLRGTVIDLLQEQLKSRTFQKVYACGPERMLCRVVELCNRYGAGCEASLERYMKCGFGLCGQCDCSGQRVCLDGPVFTSAELSVMEDFGKMEITKAGERVIHK